MRQISLIQRRPSNIDLSIRIARTWHRLPGTLPTPPPRSTTHGESMAAGEKELVFHARARQLSILISIRRRRSDANKIAGRDGCSRRGDHVARLGDLRAAIHTVRSCFGYEDFLVKKKKLERRRSISKKGCCCCCCCISQAGFNTEIVLQTKTSCNVDFTL